MPLRKFTLLSGMKVWPVCTGMKKKNPNHLFPRIEVVLQRNEKFNAYKELPHDGSFRSFEFKTAQRSSQYIIAMFDHPRTVRGDTYVGCVVDLASPLLIYDDTV